MTPSHTLRTPQEPNSPPADRFTDTQTGGQPAGLQDCDPLLERRQEADDWGYCRMESVYHYATLEDKELSTSSLRTAEAGQTFR